MPHLKRSKLEFLELASTAQVELYNQDQQSYYDDLAEERPLSLMVHGEPYAIFMRTPGDDQALVCGFLYTESLIEDLDDISALTPCTRSPMDRLHLSLESGVRLPSQNRRSFISSSCGLCSLEDGEALNSEAIEQLKNLSLSNQELQDLLEKFDHLDTIYARTGGAHAAALFTKTGELLFIAADIGRHNAVDKVIGMALLEGYEQFEELILMVSSRAGFEIVQKAIKCKVGALVTLGAASGGAHRLAQSYALALYSFLRKHKVHRHQKV